MQYDSSTFVCSEVRMRGRNRYIPSRRTYRAVRWLTADAPARIESSWVFRIEHFRAVWLAGDVGAEIQPLPGFQDRLNPINPPPPDPF